MRVRRAVTVTAVVAVAMVIGAYFVLRHIGENLPLRIPMGRACVVNAGDASANAASGSAASSGAVALDAEQIANAATITAVGITRKIPHRGLVVALATAWQESKLENLSGGDRDSIGLFQQRPSQGWGKPEQIADPRYAANAFYTGLLKVKGWEQMRVTDAAQAVQRSAHPEAYEKWADESEIMVRALTGEVTGAVACSVTEDGSHGPEAAKALGASLKLDWGNIGTADVADLVGVALKVREPKTGWQYAHWLVAHAQEHGVKRVVFNDMQWTADSGEWARVTERGGINAGPAGERVVAEVY
ncbi:hypothetical protein GCM10010399_06050 [Dactylosporangium fulvum]|uniref:ARB-07466-like C-terminal domain-containing protein n=2 Tax=Dactylosporangium fulvum TaxID=53359 RepID=A0ABY5VY84_9ACTN|nr:hypothetical protein [Dactylosporangium fulvum]UWP81448.1 hypothetical protein Dfulv_41070 [Dactylosporangium fulvum]